MLPDKFDAGDRILERQIDRLTERYKDSNPDFYRAYHVARIIVDAVYGDSARVRATPRAARRR